MAVDAMLGGPAHGVIGRNAELELLREALTHGRAAARGVLVEGEAGIGKTTVWRAGIDAAKRAGFRTLVCRPAEPEQKLSYSGLADLLEPVLAEVLTTLPPVQQHALQVALLHTSPDEDRRVDQRTVAAATLASLRSLARRGPLLIAVDDVHWLDQPSARALQFSIRRLADSPVVALVSLRIATGLNDPISLRATLPDGSVDEVWVESLSVPQIVRLLRDRVDPSFDHGTIARINDVAGGNPLFALEVARALRRSGAGMAIDRPFPAPRDIEEMIRTRVAALPSETQAALLAASAVSRPTVSVLQRVVPVSSAFKLAEAAEIITVRGDDIRFVHPLYASAVYAGAGPSELQALHARLAEVIEDPEERARHVAAADHGLSADVLDAVFKGASHAWSRGAPTAAANLYEIALRRIPDDEVVEHMPLFLRAADAHYAAGDIPVAARLMDDVLRRLPPGPETATASWYVGRMLFGVDYRRAAEALQEGLRQAGIRPIEENGAHVWLVWVLGYMWRFREAEKHARQAVEIGERIKRETGVETWLSDGLKAMGFVETRLGAGIPSPSLARALEREDIDDHYAATFASRRELAAFRILEDALDEARQQLLPLLDTAVEMADETSAGDILDNLVEVEIRAANWNAALEYLDRGAEPIRAPAGASLVKRAEAELRLGRPEGARLHAADALERSRSSGDAECEYQALSILGALPLEAGDARSAHRYLQAAWDLLRGSGIEEPGLARSGPDYAECLIQLGELEQAGQVIDWLEQRGRRLGRTWAIGGALRSRALLAAAGGHVEEAAAAADEAVRIFRATELPFELGRALVVLGIVRRRARQKRSARDALDEATTIFDRLGAAAWSRRARDERQRISGRPARANALTETEERVALLAGAGRTNREIADELYLSVKTVERHLSSVYRKLGIRSRRDLTRRAVMQGSPLR
jgi:DNA-binding CsgD family transcriptional regulator